jgi:hypothetical protein
VGINPLPKDDYYVEPRNEQRGVAVTVIPDQQVYAARPGESMSTICSLIFDKTEFCHAIKVFLKRTFSGMQKLEQTTILLRHHMILFCYGMKDIIKLNYCFFKDI